MSQSLNQKPPALAGAVILYHPEDSVCANLKTFCGILERLYVFDNSPGECADAVKKILDLPLTVTYLTEGGNAGLARALNATAERASQDGFGWMLTMDQDSCFEDGMAADFYEAFQKLRGKEECAVISPSHWKQGGKEDAAGDPVDRPVVMTSGNILNLAAHRRLGGFAEDLFIDTVDHDYCLRARAAGFRVVQYRHVFLKHQVGNSLFIKRSGRKVRLTTHAPERMYYITRNNFRLWFRHYGKDGNYIRHRIAFYFGVTLRNILFHEDRKLEKLRYAARGGFDFLRGRYGPYRAFGSAGSSPVRLPPQKSV